MVGASTTHPTIG